MNSDHTQAVTSMSLEDFRQTIIDAGNAWQKRKEDLQNLVESKPLLLFGFGGKGKVLAHQIRQITGKEVTVFDGSTSKRDAARAQGFRTIDQFKMGDGACWATVLGACQAQLEQKSTVQQNYIFYQEAATLFNVPLLSHLAEDFKSFVSRNLEVLYSTYLALHPTSRLRFVKVLCFRLSSDPQYLQAMRQPSAEMWLDIPAAFTKRNYKNVLDVGAFDGDTLRSFSQRFGCERGIAVEANPSLFDSIRKSAMLYPRGIEIMPKAAWSSTTHLSFEELRFGMIQVTESVAGQLSAAPIDAYVQEQVDFLKMDIEGAESEALTGCRVLLKNSQPDLAIAAYHRPGDFVDLYKQILEHGYGGGNFTWHFGHYSDCLDDSIFYVIRNR
jgi:FkbM family methyltransferase